MKLFAHHKRTTYHKYYTGNLRSSNVYLHPVGIEILRTLNIVPKHINYEVMIVSMWPPTDTYAISIIYNSKNIVVGRDREKSEIAMIVFGLLEVIEIFSTQNIEIIGVDHESHHHPVVLDSLNIFKHMYNLFTVSPKVDTPDMLISISIRQQDGGGGIYYSECWALK